MVGFGVTAILVLLPHISSAATLYAEKEKSTMRRERPTGSVQLSAQGDFVQASRMTEAKSQPQSKSAQFCDYDFPLGKEGTNECAASSHSQIVQENMCIEAAQVSDAATFHSSFRLASEWEGKHPQGCFKATCAEATNKVCYFFNGDGDKPAGTVEGTPVCSRPQYLNGTTDSNSACPDGYKVIDDEAACASAALCLGHPHGVELRIGLHNPSRHLLFPHGCFVHSTDGFAYFNQLNKTEAVSTTTAPLTTVTPAELGSMLTVKSTEVKGTPICVVAKRNPA